MDASFEQESTLGDGRPVRMRFIRPSDGALLRDGFARLSPASRYARFHTSLRELPNELVHGLTHVDGVDHVAIVALDGSAPSGREPRGFGVARFVRATDDPTRAEVAVTVADDAQRLGLASRLLVLLAAAARERGIATLVAYVLFDNAKARRRVRAFGGRAVSSDHGLVTYHLPVERLLQEAPALAA